MKELNELNNTEINHNSGKVKILISTPGMSRDLLQKDIENQLVKGG